MEALNPRAGGVVPAPRKYPNELRDRAQRRVGEAPAEDLSLSLYQAVVRIGPRIGVNPDTLRGWCRQAAVDAGERRGTTSSDAKADQGARELALH
jgi:transposase